MKSNIIKYLCAAEDFGIPEDKMFGESDLFSGMNPFKVIESIKELKKKVN
jgi:hypothetical protein